MARKVKEEKIKGIGGWLIVYLVMLGLALIFNIRDLVKSIISEMYVDSIFTFISMIVVIFMLYFIVKKSSKAPKFNIIGLWLDFVIVSVVANAYTIFSSDDHLLSLSFRIGTYVVSLIISSLLTFIWVGYWKESKRVKNTFIE